MLRQRTRVARLMQALLALVIGGAAVLLAAKAVSDETPFDIGLAYMGGETAWDTGRPEELETWISTPFLGMVMALVSRAVDLPTAVTGMTILNLGLAVSLIAAIWTRLRHELSPRWWWTTLAGAVLFAPLLSSIWWKQLNVVALSLAVVGFSLLRSGRDVLGAAMTALSLAVKPIFVLLPLALLLRKETRKSGLWALVWIAIFIGGAQAFLAVRAGTPSALSPLPMIEALSERSQPENVWACHTENFAPGSLLCRLAGGRYWTQERVLVLLMVILFAALAHDSIRHRGGKSWSVFAFASLLSPLISPIAWSHYQLLLAPMLVVLVCEFVRRGASLALWGSLAASFALTELVWRPYGTLPGTVNRHLADKPETPEALFAVMSVAQFAQYLLFFTAVLWFATHQRAGPGPDDVATKSPS